MHGHCIEVKARRTAAQPWVQISNEHQLTDVADHRLWLAILAVERVAEPFGNTLTDYAERVGQRFLTSNAGIGLEWELALSAAGYRQEDDYSAFRWVSGAPNWHEVVEGFPRVAAPPPAGVSNVRYSIALSACAPFQSGPAAVEAALSEGYSLG